MNTFLPQSPVSMMALHRGENAYLLGRSFTLGTNHNSVRWLTGMKEPEGQLARCLEKLGVQLKD